MRQTVPKSEFFRESYGRFPRVGFSEKTWGLSGLLGRARTY